jgi:hypothetical protein
MSVGRKTTQLEKQNLSREIAAKAEEKRAAEVTKTARLRALRLAKEAADRDAISHATPPRRGAVRSRRVK